MSKSRTRNVVVQMTCAALIWALLPAPALAAGARLEGFVLGVEGKAASGYRIHLIDREGVAVAQASTSDDGIYRFRDLDAGHYALGVENPDGAVAPVASPPVRLNADELARRDIKLVQAGTEERERVGVENRSFGMFWAGLSPAAKAWSVIGVIVIIGVTVQALDDDDDNGTKIDPE